MKLSVQVDIDVDIYIYRYVYKCLYGDIYIYTQFTYVIYVIYIYVIYICNIYIYVCVYIYITGKNSYLTREFMGNVQTAPPLWPYVAFFMR